MYLSLLCFCFIYSSFFFFNDTATTEIYTLSLHDALPISRTVFPEGENETTGYRGTLTQLDDIDRKSTRLNSSHRCISYAVFCLKKKKKKLKTNLHPQMKTKIQ